QNLPGAGVLSQSVTAQMLDDLDGQTLQEAVAGQQFKQSWTRAGHVDFCHWGAGMKMGEFPFDNSSHYTNLHAIYLSRVSLLGCISGKNCPFRERAAGSRQPCVWASLAPGGSQTPQFQKHWQWGVHPQSLEPCFAWL